MLGIFFMDPEAKLLIILFSCALALAATGIAVVYALIRRDRKKSG
jgi:hypothetical protein